jgi:hypothetical protein
MIPCIDSKSLGVPRCSSCWRTYGERWSEWFHFRTASTRAEPFSFIYFGDAQNDILSLWSRVLREGYATAPRARFMIHAGDMGPGEPRARGPGVG